MTYPPPLSIGMLALCLFMTAASTAQPAIAILQGPRNIHLSAGGVPGELTAPKSLAFLHDFTQAIEQGGEFPAELPLVNPPEWGKSLSEATGGSIQYMPSFDGGFVGLLTLEGLEPNHPYRLALNGKPELEGNNLLPTPVPDLPNERFYDFLDVVADECGRYQATLGVELRAGEYNVRLYVKDPDDWKIVLYRDYFEFAVE